MQERDDDGQRKKQIRRAGIDPGRTGGDRGKPCQRGAGNRGNHGRFRCGQKGVADPEKKGVVSTGSKKEVKLVAASGSSIRVEGDAKLEFTREGKKCCMKFLDADVKRPLASVSAIVDGGNKVMFGRQESCIENESTGQSVPMSGRKGVFVVQLNVVIGSKAKEKTS